MLRMMPLRRHRDRDRGRDRDPRLRGRKVVILVLAAGGYQLVVGSNREERVDP